MVPLLFLPPQRILIQRCGCRVLHIIYMCISHSHQTSNILPGVQQYMYLGYTSDHSDFMFPRSCTQWVPLNIIPSVHPLLMILSRILYYLRPYICSIRTAHARILPRTDLPCASARVYSCQRLAKASTSTSLSTQSVVVELISRECAESSLFWLCLLATRDSRQ